MKKINSITIYKGITTEIEFDFTDFIFESGVVELNIRNIKTNDLVFTFTFAIPNKYVVILPSELTQTLEEGLFNYLYDLVWITETNVYLQCLPSNVYVYGTVFAGDLQ